MSLFVSHRIGRGMSISTRVSPWVLVFLLPFWLSLGALSLGLMMLASLFGTLAKASDSPRGRRGGR